MFGSIFSTALGWAGGNQLRLFAGLAVLISAAAFAAGVYLHIRGLHGQIDVLQKEKTQLTADNMVLQQNVQIAKDNLAKVVQANSENYSTIQKLVADRAQSQQAIAELARAATDNKRAADVMNSTLAKLTADPKNDGPVAPALRETIRQIQQNRTSLQNRGKK